MQFYYLKAAKKTTKQPKSNAIQIQPNHYNSKYPIRTKTKYLQCHLPINLILIVSLIFKGSVSAMSSPKKHSILFTPNSMDIMDVGIPCQLQKANNNDFP